MILYFDGVREDENFGDSELHANVFQNVLEVVPEYAPATSEYGTL